MLKKILSCILVIAMLASAAPMLIYASETAVAQPTPEYNDMTTNITQYGGNYYDKTYNTKVTVTDGSAPVGIYVQHGCLVAGGDTGIRLGQRLQAEKGEIWVAEYWVKATAAEGSTEPPAINGFMQYTKNENSGSTYLKDINNTDYVSLESGKWHKRYQLFQITETTTGLTEGDLTGIRFVLQSGKYAGQVTCLGDLSLYSFPESYAYGELTGTDAVAAYIENTSLSALYAGGDAIEGFAVDTYEYEVAYANLASVSAEAVTVYSDVTYDTSLKDKVTVTVSAYPYNNGALTLENSGTVLTQSYVINGHIPAESALSDSYDLDLWEVGGKSYCMTSDPEMTEEDGRVALKYDTKDSVHGGGTGATFRAQLPASGLKASEGWAVDDRFYVSFWAKAESRYGNQTKIGLVIEKLNESGGSGGNISNSTSFNLDSAWKQYYAILTLTDVAELGARIRMQVGYYGQTTYISDFEIHLCNADSTNSEVIGYFRNETIEDMVKNEALVLAGAGSGDTKLGNIETVTEFASDPPVAFENAYKFTSTEYNNTSNTNNKIGNYKARLASSNVYSHTANPGDKLLLTFWAYGEYTGTVEGETAWMRPDIQASSNGSGGTSVGYLNADGKAVTTEVSVPSEWKRYAYIFEIPVSTGYDMQINWHIGKTNQSITFADVQLYNLGAISVSEAFGYLDDTDAALFYRTKPMSLNADGTYTAYAANGTESLAEADFTAIGTNKFTSYNVTSYPSAIGDSGVIELIAPDGTVKEAAFSIEEMDALTADAGYYSGGGKLAILKFDDYFADSELFKPSVEMVKKHGMKVALGVSGQKWVNASEEEWAQLKEWADDPDIEIWHHGYQHSTSEYSTNTYEQQKTSFENTMELMREHGIEITSFGSPNNNSTLVTAKMIYENFPEITNVMLAADNSIYATKAIINFDNRVDIEAAKEEGQNKTGVLNLDAFKTNIDNASFGEVIVIQGHASMWDEAEIADLDLALTYMEEKGITTVLPSEHAATLKAREEITALPGGNVTAEVNLKSGTADLKELTVIYAVYNNSTKVLESVNTVDVTLEAFEEKMTALSASVPTDGGSYYTKLFVWDNLENIAPLTGADVFGE